MLAPYLSKVPIVKRTNLHYAKLSKIGVRQSSTTAADALTLDSFRSPKVFANRSFGEIAFGYFILRSCSFPPILKYGPKFLEGIEKLGLIAPVHWVISKTYYKYFVAGTALQDSWATVDKLSKDGIGSILDYSIESDDGNVGEVVDILVESIRKCCGNVHTPFSCFKITALASGELLLRLSGLLKWHEEHPDFSLPWIELPNHMNQTQFIESLVNESAKVPEEITQSGGVHLGIETKMPPKLTTSELREFHKLVGHLERLGEASEKYNVSLLVDAEQTYYQRAIHFLAWSMTKRYNRERPLIYNTYQLYLKDGLSKLKSHLEQAKQEGAKLGAKLVRGAYMESEAEWAKQHLRECPIFESIEQTHDSYNSGVDVMIQNVKSNSAGLVIATHNEESVLLASKMLQEYGVSPKNPNVYFAQLYGMCDHISLALVASSHNVCKYVPFGPVAEVMPYLLRRVQENRAFLGSTKYEQVLLFDELKARLIGSSNKV